MRKFPGPESSWVFVFNIIALTVLHHDPIKRRAIGACIENPNELAPLRRWDSVGIPTLIDLQDLLGNVLGACEIRNNSGNKRTRTSLLQLKRIKRTEGAKAACPLQRH